VGAPGGVVGLGVRRSQAVAPDDVVGGVDVPAFVEIVGDIPIASEISAPILGSSHVCNEEGHGKQNQS
jgi:hypothetical protein